MAEETPACSHSRTGKAQEPRLNAEGVEVMMIVSMHCLDCGEVLVTTDKPIPSE